MPALTPLEIETLQLSLRVGLVSVAASLPFGIAIAWLLARRQFPGKIVVDGLVHLPLVLPPVVVGYALLVLFGRNGPIGGWLYDLFGVRFNGHPGLKRILLPEDWTGFPMRKDRSITAMDNTWVQHNLGIESGQ